MTVEPAPASEGTQELKRRDKAAPDPERGHGIRAASIALLIALALFSVDRIFHGFVLTIIAAPIAAGVAFYLFLLVNRIWTLTEVQARWARNGLRCLLVHSDSPTWKGHIAERWLPRFGHLAKTLNWTRRSEWWPTLEVRVFKDFCGENRNFNPAVVVFRGVRYPLVFRFYEAFHQAKAGRPQYLEELERRLFVELGVAGEPEPLDGAARSTPSGGR